MNNPLHTLYALLTYAADNALDVDVRADVLHACRDITLLHGPVTYVEYNATAWFRKLGTDPQGATHLTGLSHEFSQIENGTVPILRDVSIDVEPVPDCVGDPDATLACVRTILLGAEYDPGTTIAMEVFEDEKLGPVVALSFDGTGGFPPHMHVTGLYRMDFATLEEAWFRATHGARIKRTGNGLILRLFGQAPIPKPLETVALIRPALCKALTAADPKESLQHINEAIETIDAHWRPSEQATLASLLEEASLGDNLERARCETTCPDDIPPIALRRDHMLALLAAVEDYAATEFPRGVDLQLLVGYGRESQMLRLDITMNGTDTPAQVHPALNAMRHIVQTIHSGTCDVLTDKGEALFEIALPDTIGSTVNEWIPGYYRFGGQSQQMLRLLKSGGPAPPEDFILSAVLEDELERFFLPRFRDPAVVNATHKVSLTSTLPGGSTDRLKKAITQIQRGKPRKEVAAPLYATEILWSLRDMENAAKALGLGVWHAEQVETFCQALLRSPDNPLPGLQQLAELLARNTQGSA